MKLKNLLSKIGKDYFYLMHLSYDDVPSREPLWRYAYDKNRIGLSLRRIYKDWSEVPERTRRSLTKPWYRQFELFCEKMNVGDCVLVMEGMTHLLGVGIIKGPHEFKNIPKTKEYPDGFFNHARPVRWLIKYKYENRIPFKTTFENTIAYVDSSSPRWRLIDRELDIKNTGLRTVGKIEEVHKAPMLRRKYGPRGEGEDHKKLKEWVKKHPKHIGLKNVTYSADERYFNSGDCVDIYFECRSNKYATVEIETSNPYPGIFQALKYKVLLCAELGWDIKSPDVKAILVAKSPLTKKGGKLCKKYGIEFYRFKNATCTERI